MAHPRTSAKRALNVCPYWHEVAADFASLYPSGGYCLAGCHKRVKVMAERTFHDFCAMNFAECEGYQRLLAEEQTKRRQTLGTLWR